MMRRTDIVPRVKLWSKVRNRFTLLESSDDEDCLDPMMIDSSDGDLWSRALT